MYKELKSETNENRILKNYSLLDQFNINEEEENKLIGLLSEKLDQTDVVIIPDYGHGLLTEKVIKAFYVVYNTLGFGFLEKVYENALVHELGKTQLAVKQQERFDVRYDGILVGEYFADVVAENLGLVELKSSKQLIDKDEAWLLNYLKATEYEVSLLLNFGTKP